MRESLEDTDLALLSELENDARTSFAALADRLGLSPTAAARRLQRLEEQGVVRGYRLEIDWRRLGFEVTAFVTVTLARQSDEVIQAFETTVVQYPEVLEVHLMTGTSDYLLRVLVRDLGGYEAFLKQRLTRIRGVAHVQTAFALSALKAGPPPVSMLAKPERKPASRKPARRRD